MLLFVSIVMRTSCCVLTVCRIVTYAKQIFAKSVRRRAYVAKHFVRDSGLNVNIALNTSVKNAQPVLDSAGAL